MTYCIDSLLTQDFYKFSMGQFATHRYPACKVKVEFVCRSGQLLGDLKNDLDKELDHFCSLRYTDEEIDYLKTINWLSEDFIDDLSRFQPDRKQIKTSVDENGKLSIVAEGPWREVIWFEVPVLAMVQELYFRDQLVHLAAQTSCDEVYTQYCEDRSNRLMQKAIFFNSINNKCNKCFTFSDFGLRRRISGSWHDNVVKTLHEKCFHFVGTSNVFLAKKYGIKPIGTMAHELYMALQSYYPLHLVQKEVWKEWMEEYRGKNGILLSDIFGFDACLKDLDWYTANSFQGLRHDSGDPIEWGNKLIKFYNSVGIDPKTKVLCWSDTLVPETCEKLVSAFGDKCKVSFGIGTNLVADSMIKPLSIVMKLTYSNGYPVIKLPDGSGKVMCPDPELERYARHVFNRELK